MQFMDGEKSQYAWANFRSR